MEPGRIILLIVLALFCEGNFRYYDFKGSGPVSPFRSVYKMLPGPVAGLLRGAGHWWGRVVHGRVPVTLLPDHVMLCVPMSVEWDNAAAGSPEAAYREDVEAVMRSVAKRHAQPGVTWDENRFHYGRAWIGYADEKGVEVYRKGERLSVPVAIGEYAATGSNLICGNTTGREDGPEKYRAFAVTFSGEILKAD